MTRNGRSPQIMDTVARHALCDISAIANEMDESYTYKLLF